MTMTELCGEIRNWFVVLDGVHTGDFSVVDGELLCDGTPLPYLREGQYFRVVGSVFNDGVWQVPAVLVDEEFTGAVWAMAVPAEVVSLLSDINDWEAQHGAAAMSPFSSESFGGYTYQRAEGASDVRAVFRSRLRKWRKL